MNLQISSSAFLIYTVEEEKKNLQMRIIYPNCFLKLETKMMFLTLK